MNGRDRSVVRGIETRMSHDRGHFLVSGPAGAPRRPIGPIVRAARYAWAFPTSALGLALAALAWAGRGRLSRVEGTLEAHGGWILPLLDRATPFVGRIEAFALGHVIVGRSASALEECRGHERVHVRQCERWGPLFLPAYAAATMAALWRGEDPYLGNRFEREAREGDGASSARRAGARR
ncbi:MAG TPA: hypothetical protein VFM17_09520 [Candidatus Eisenbacteria bacterium]|nr:hypothetical protein [Candidatus Eisenbacteria bacterium]